jgi:thiamine biosynthesis lipoprotein
VIRAVPPVTDGLPGVHRIHHLEEVMGTVVTIDVWGDPDGPLDAIVLLVRDACDVLHRADAVFSTWIPDSPINRLRRDEITWQEAPLAVSEVQAACATARALSGGWFDPWEMPGGFDPTGYVKGWAAQQAVEAIASPLVSGAIVNAAGDIASIGIPGPDRAFRFGIADPASPGDLLCTVEPPGALATSGTYERGEHLIDPSTGAPYSRVASASVTGDDLGLADALATAVAVAGEDGLDLIEPLSGFEALTVAFDGTVRWTSAFPLVALATSAALGRPDPDGTGGIGGPHSGHGR